jgi:hypothetical protein
MTGVDADDLAAALRERVEGEVRFDAGSRGAYSTDASNYRQVPIGVVNLRQLEYFSDHARVDRLLFDGVLDPTGGVLAPDLTRPGMGLELKRADAERYRKESR